ncbi:MAG: hypothetical protein EOP83_15605 [Verrucomicrobiaceae bacterium]|nr:MAG: hypothetical protein EOP83_15605 [Verrucomicrobiaceae bacterium]
MSDDIQTRIRNGEFKPKAPYPVSPEKPAILARTIGDLDGDEFAVAQAAWGRFRSAEIAYKEAVKAYSAEAGACENAFVAALAEYHGVTGHPKAGMVYMKAYEHGHSAGHSEVANYYADFVDLIK